MEQRAYKHVKSTQCMEYEAPKSLFKQKDLSGKLPVFVYRDHSDKNGKFFRLRLPKYIGRLSLPNISKFVSRLHKVKKIHSLNLLKNSIKPLKLVRILTQQRKHIKCIQNDGCKIASRTLAYFPGLSDLHFKSTEAKLWSLKLKGHFCFKSLTLDLIYFSGKAELLSNQELLKRFLCKIA